MSSRHNVLGTSSIETLPTKVSDQKEVRNPEHPLIFIGGIPKQVTRSDIQTYLSRFGKLKYFSMPYHLFPDNHKGFAKAFFKCMDIAQGFLNIKDHKVKGMQVAVLPWVGKKKFVSRKEQPSTAKLFMKFKEPVSEVDLVQYFCKFGAVERIDLKMNYKTQEQRGFGFILFSNSEDATAVLRFSTSHLIRGNEILMSSSKSTTELCSNSKQKEQADPNKPSNQDISSYSQKIPFCSSVSSIHLQSGYKKEFQTNPVRRVGSKGSQPVSEYYGKPKDHFTKPNSRKWNHERVDFNHKDTANLLFKKAKRRLALDYFVVQTLGTHPQRKNGPIAL